MLRRRTAVCAVLAVLVLLGGGLALLAAATDDEVVVSAHRGGAAYAPENTMVAFRNAVRLGVDELETDLQLTADGEMVLLHDAALERTTDCTGLVRDTTYAELVRCDAAHWWSPGRARTVGDVDAEHPLRGTGIGVPRLAELLDLAVGLGEAAPRLSIELKSNADPTGAALARRLVTAVTESGIDTGRVLVQSFSATALDEVQRLDAELETQFLTYSRRGPAAQVSLRSTIDRDYDVSSFNHDAPDFTAELVAEAHDAGKRVIPFTPNSAAAMRAALDKDVDGLITDRPACLLQLLGRPVPEPVAVTGEIAACAPQRPGLATAVSPPSLLVLVPVVRRESWSGSCRMPRTRSWTGACRCAHRHGRRAACAAGQEET